MAETRPAATMDDCRTTYDVVAEEYTRRVFDELEHKPSDRLLLDRFLDSVQAGLTDADGTLTVCDMGCGPGHVARYLHDRLAATGAASRVRVCGVDLSPAMVATAQRLTPSVPFSCGDMRALGDSSASSGSWAGIVAFYSIIHVQPPELPTVFREFWRVLTPGGYLLLGFHAGDKIIQLDEWWGYSVLLDCFFHQPARIAELLREAGFAVLDVLEREPIPGAEYPSQRAYVLARKPVVDRT